MTWKKLLELIKRYENNYYNENIVLVLHSDGSGHFRDLTPLYGDCYSKGVKKSFGNLKEFQELCQKT